LFDKMLPIRKKMFSIEHFGIVRCI